MNRLNCAKIKVMLFGFVAVIVVGNGQNAKADFTWTQKADMPTPRWLHTSAVVNGKVYVIGGSTSEPDSKALSTVEEYDPVTNTWTRKADIPIARTNMIGSSAVVDGKIYVIGGDDNTTWGSPTVYKYNPSTDTWTRKADMPTPRWCLATRAVDGKIYAIGGAPNSITGLNVVEQYDPATDTWMRKANMPTGVWGLCACVVDGKIYALGGRPGYSAIPNVQEYDPATDTWMRKAYMPVGTSGMAAVVVGDKIIVIGGWRASGNSPYKAVQIYDPETDTWTREADTPFLRACCSTSVFNNRIYVIGGTDRPHPCPATSTVYELTINPPAPDFNGDGIIDSADMCIMVDHWGEDYPLCDIGPMPWGDGIVDVQDLIVLAEHLFEEVEVYDPTLVAHWPLDEAQGDVAYDNVAICDGTLRGDPVWQPAGGIVDGALQLDGVDDFIFISSIPNLIKGPFSVLAWIKGGAPGQVVISQRGGVNWLCADTSEGNLMTELKGTGRNVGILESQAVITDGNWHRICLVWDGSHRTLYLDDLAVAEDTLSNLEVSENSLLIGTGKAMKSGTYWSGLIDDVRIYNRAVSP
ncbi:MAG: kelch repeat-containing protein [Phycisphaerae bacterium]